MFVSLTAPSLYLLCSAAQVLVVQGDHKEFLRSKVFKDYIKVNGKVAMYLTDAPYNMKVDKKTRARAAHDIMTSSQMGQVRPCACVLSSLRSDLHHGALRTRVNSSCCTYLPVFPPIL